MDYKLLAGYCLGFISSVPLTIGLSYLAYLRISLQVRKIINEYGRGETTGSQQL
ncbi:protein 3a [Rose spring dwarf-associated virus]|uniref:protein 3a n=1 Tax=Rose spring dwarf-associated virus TaxID=474454 RepID=UPI00070F3501|nr:protein 3a [Rose spring dwarf-associated virus]UBR90291.1 protein 3a [Rose spring dwarf-associated virus]